jgi:hypothetical protein
VLANTEQIESGYRRHFEELKLQLIARVLDTGWGPAHE